VLEAVARKRDLDDFACGEIAHECAAHADNVEHARIVGPERRPQRISEALITSVVVVTVSPADLEVISLREIADLGPQPGGDIGAPDRDPRVLVMRHQIYRDARSAVLGEARVRRR
jgi:hypothetical protein